MALQQALLAFALAPLAASVGVEGAAECPCISGSGYGFGCYAHDFNGSSGSPQCAAGNPADWCEVCSSLNPADWCDDQWCYVDEKNCSITHEETQPLGRFWSYTTCGYRDLFSLENITESIRGKTLRVLYISNTGGWKGNYCTGVKGQPCVGERGFGPVQRLFQVTSASAGFHVEQKELVPSAVKDQLERVLPGGGTFDLCPWGTGMGYFDVCMTSTVMLPRRVDASHFIALWAEPTILVGPVSTKEQDMDFGAMIVTAFKPFSLSLWLVFLSVSLCLAWIISIIELDTGGQFGDSDEDSDPGCLGFLGDCLYYSFLGTVQFSTVLEPKTLGGRILSLGLAFWLLLAVCGYTASLASFFVVSQRLHSPIDDLSDAIRLNYKICVHRTERTLALDTGVLESNLVILSQRSDVLTGVGSSCQAAVLRQEDFEAAQAANGGSFCHLGRIGDPVHSAMIGIPVSKQWVWPLRHAIMTSIQAGEWQKALDNYRPKDYCTALQAEAEAKAEPAALEVAGMSGPLMITLAITVLGCALQGLYWCYREDPPCWRPRRRGEEQPKVQLSNEALRQVQEMHKGLKKDLQSDLTEALRKFCHAIAAKAPFPPASSNELAELRQGQVDLSSQLKQVQDLLATDVLVKRLRYQDAEEVVLNDSV